MTRLSGALAAGLVVVACSGDDSSGIPPPPDAGEQDAGRDVAVRDQYVPDTSLPAAGTVQVGGCAAFTACGGTLAGTWDYTGGCVPDPLADATSVCSSITVQNQTASAQGRISFIGGNVIRDSILSYSSNATVPKSCADSFGGCSSISAVIKAQIGLDKAFCMAGSTGDCACTFSISQTDMSTDTYMVQGNQIVTGKGDTYDYCVGSKLDYSHVSGPSSEKGVLELTHE